MKFFLKVFLSLVLQNIYMICCFSQIQEQYQQSFLSPNAASLARFTDLPVNQYTGAIDLSIPIFDIEEGHIPIKLGLSYNSTGNKVEDIAPWTGLGWSLVGVPRISRQVRGLPDEDTDGMMFKYNGKTIAQYAANMTSGERLNMQLALSNGMVDTELDIFHLTINGYSGRFYFDQTSNKFLTEKQSNILIFYNNTAKIFTVIDENGIQYKFDVKETSTVNEISTGKLLTTSWLPSEISSPTTPNKVIFSYNTENHIYRKIGTQVRYVELGRMNSFPTQELNDSYEMQLVQSSAKNLSAITFSKGKILFLADDVMREDLTGSYALKHIRILNNVQELVKEMQFNYLYKTGSGNSGYGSNKWMFLSEITIPNSKNPIEKEQYFLEYENKVPSSRISFAQDYWGYFNGNNTNTSLIPTSSFIHPKTNNNIVINGANRDVNSSFSDFGVLKKIVYPTRGYAEFLYESNQVMSAGIPTGYETEVRYIAAEGGDPTLPIQPVHSEYVEQFTINNAKDVILNGDNPSGGVYINVDVANLGVPPGHYGATLTLRGTSSTNSHIRLTFYESFVNYYLPNGTYELKGVFDQDPANYLDFHCFVTWKKLTPALGGNKLSGGLRIKELKSYTSNAILASKTEYRYLEEWDKEKSSGLLFGSANINHGSFIRVNGYHYSSFENKYYVTAIDYYRLRAFPNIEMINQNASYTGYTSVYEVKNSGDETSITQNIYSNSQDEINPVPPFLPAQSLKEHNGKLMQQTLYKTSNSGLIPVSKKVNTYYFGVSDPTFYNFYSYYYDPNVRTPTMPAQLAEGNQYNLPTIEPYTFQRIESRLQVEKTFQYVGGLPTLESSTDYTYNGLQQLISVDRNQSDGKLIRTKFFYPNTLTLTPPYESARIWMVGKNMFAHLLREQNFVVNNGESLLLEKTLLYKQFNSNPSSIFKSVSTSKSGVNNENLSNFNFLNYDFYGNPVETKKDNRLITVYLWGYQGQYPIAKIENTTYTEVRTILTQAVIDNLHAASLSEADMETLITNVGKKLRTDFRLSKAQVSTYTYKPLVGMTSMTDPRGITEYYEYDGFQRLKDVLDFENNVLKDYRYNYRP